MTKDGIALLEKIYNYIITNKGKTINMLADEMKLSRSTVQKAIHKLNLENYVIYNDNVSYPEKELQYFITEELQKYAVYNSRNIISPQELDIYIPEKKIAIEFDGNYWHSDEYKDKNYHRDKSLNCTNKGIRLIHIFEYEWNDDRKKQIIKNIIKGILIDNNKVYARNTVIKEIDTNSYREFCNKYHLQGYAPAEVKIGCFYNNELIGIMSFGKPRFNSEYEYELIRLCWVNEISVIGGTEKLFAYFKNNYEPKSIITYNNISKFTGTVYTRIGFRYQTQKDKLVKAGLGTEKQTEEEIMRKLQYHRVYDCGNLKLEWKQQ
jgi:very-short-patch-repair endonuclease